MSLEICLFLCVIVINITIIIIKIIEKYPEWVTYYEYKEKAKSYDELKDKHYGDVKEITKTIIDIKSYFKNDSHKAYDLLDVILKIKIALKEKSSVKAIETIKSILTKNNL